MKLYTSFTVHFCISSFKDRFSLIVSRTCVPLKWKENYFVGKCVAKSTVLYIVTLIASYSTTTEQLLDVDLYVTPLKAIELWRDDF